MNVYWPAGLPDPQFGNTISTSEGRLESEGDIASRQRIIDPNYRQSLSVSWNLTEIEFRVLESWYRHRINDGISWFEMEWAGLQGWAHFSGNLSASLNGEHWQVSGKAELDYAVSG